MLPDNLENQVKHHNFSEPFRQMFTEMAKRIVQLESKVYCAAPDTRTLADAQTISPRGSQFTKGGFDENDVVPLESTPRRDRAKAKGER